MPFFYSHKFIRLSLVLLLTQIYLMVAASARDNELRWEQLSQPYFETIKQNDRPLIGPIRAIAQDKNDFIWIVSDNTLWRWDAYELKQVSIQQTNESQSSPDIQTIESDPEGNIWVGSTNGLYRVQAGSAFLQRVQIDGFNDLSIEFLKFDFSNGKKNIYIANEFQAYQYSLNSQRLQLLKLYNSLNNRIHAIHVTRNNTLWIGTNDGLYYKSLIGTNDSELKRFQGIAANTRISALYSSLDNRMWIGTAKAGVFVLNEDKKIQKISLPTHNGNLPWVYDITEIDQGKMWFGTFGHGLLEYEEINNQFRFIQQQRLLKSNLLDNDIWKLFRDKRGLIWVGSRLGVNMFNAPQKAFIHIPGGDARINLSDPLIYSILAMPDQTLWLGTGKQGIDIIHPTKGIIRHLIPGSRIGSATIPVDPIESLTLINNETVFAGSNWGTLQINNTQRTASPFYIPGRAPDAYSSAFAWYRNQLWVGGIDGLWVVPKQPSNITQNIFNLSGGDKRVSRLFTDGDILWVGTWAGLKRVIYSDKIPGNFQIQAIKDPRIQRQYITAFAKDTRDRIWVGTYSAGLFFNTLAGINNNAPWQSISKKDGLTDNSISGIQVDNKGHIWIGSNQGISFINGNDLQITTIHSEEGAPAAPYETSAQTKSGEIVFGGGYGLTIINPDLWRPSLYKPKLVISNAESDSKKPLVMQIRQDEAGFNQSWLVVPPKTMRLAIDFAAIDYIAAQWIHYRYRLIGHDDNWIETIGQHRTATFTSLMPGKYELQVQFSYDGNKWKNNILSQWIELQPTWYQQWWFKISMLAILISLAFIAIQWRDRRYKARQQTLEKRVSERTKELESANSLLKKQSASIEQASMTDSLTGLKNRRFLTQHIESDAQIALRRYLKPTGNAENIESQADLVFYIIDIDHFKRINDRYGHIAGDEVLIEMRRRLLTVFRGADYVVRWGGEEFLAVARGSSRANASEMAERIRHTITQQPFLIGKGLPIDLTCSIGYAAYPFFIDSPEALNWSETFALADTALYAAKNSGRNTWCGFDATNHTATDSLISAARDVPVDLDKLLPLQTCRNFNSLL